MMRIRRKMKSKIRLGTRALFFRVLSSLWVAKLVMLLRIRERKESVTVLLCGTSGCGKSTLSSLLIEGSVDEESTKSDEYNDLAMQDIQENGYWSENGESYEDSPAPVLPNQSARGLRDTHGDNYKQNLARFLRNKSELTSVSHGKKVPSPRNARVKRRSHGISMGHF